MFFKKKPIEKEVVGDGVDTNARDENATYAKTVDDVIDDVVSKVVNDVLSEVTTLDDLLDEIDRERSSIYDRIEPYYDLPKGNVVLNRILFRSEHYILIELDPDERCMVFDNIIIHSNTIKSATVSVYTDSTVTYDDFLCTTFNSPLPKPTVLYRKYVSNRHVVCILTGDAIDAVRISFRPTYVKDELRRKERYFRRYLDYLS